jgi:hypothetical protein
MKGTAPIITCDDEDGCTEWDIDYYEMGASNWRELMPGWQYNPYGSGEGIYCREHAQEAVGS